MCESIVNLKKLQGMCHDYILNFGLCSYISFPSYLYYFFVLLMAEQYLFLYISKRNITDPWDRLLYKLLLLHRSCIVYLPLNAKGLFLIDLLMFKV